jgi:hypothetical protein
MKKTIFFIAALFLIISAKSQGVQFGVKGGLNASSLNSSPTNEDMQTKIGFNVGLLGHIHTANESWAIQPELYYSAEGAKSKANNDVSTNLGFINIPVLAQYMFDNGFRLEAGPQLDLLMSAKNKNNNTSTDIKDALNTAGFSIPVGVGYLTRTGLGFDARYNFGMSNIYKNATAKVKSNVFQFDIFYQFSHTKK